MKQAYKAAQAKTVPIILLSVFCLLIPFHPSQAVQAASPKSKTVTHHENSKIDKGANQLDGDKRGPERDTNGGRHHAHGEDRMFEKLSQDLQLTEDQKQKMDSLRKEAKSQAEPLKKSMWKKKRSAMEYASSPDATLAKALEMQKDSQSTLNQLETLRITTWFKMRAILTPDQLKQLAVKQKAFHDKMPEQFKNHKPGDGPPDAMDGPPPGPPPEDTP
ncbi:MAG: Spy/CpxP family protein refolding chaperone [Cyanobacteria bacterium]|nr:Spy/CpxP family protein refolding chaperone [Cyanobacteriota bacterium]